MRTGRMMLVWAAVLLLVGGAQAQIGGTAVAVDQADVLREVEPEPPSYAVNSAIVLTNPHNVRAEFKIALYDNDGSPAGGGSAVVGPHQLKVIWVSTLLNDETRRFVGWGAASSSQALQTSAFLVGIGTTRLPVESQRLRNDTAAARRKLFSVLAAF